MQCVCHTATTLQKLFCLHVFRQVGPPQRVKLLGPKLGNSISVLPMDTATRYSIGI